MVVFLFRPSPQVPEPSVRAAEKCFEASEFNVHVQREQIETKSVDLTWIFTQSLFMALNTLLWALSYPEIRKQHPKSEVENHLRTAQDAIFLASERWPGVDSALGLYDTLIQACLKAYDGNREASYVVGSPPTNPPTSSYSDTTTPTSLSSPSTVRTSLSSGPNGGEYDHPSPRSYVADSDYVQSTQHFTSSESSASIDAIAAQPVYSSGGVYQELNEFDPALYSNPLPAPLNYGSDLPILQGPLQPSTHDQNFYLGSIGDQYAQYLRSQYSPQETLDSLDLKQQSELMNTLESNRLAGHFDHVPPTPHFLNGTGYAT